LNAITQYAADNAGALPAGIGTTAAVIGNNVGEINICSQLVTRYLAGLPRDPTTAGGDITDCLVAGQSTGYYVKESGGTDHRVTVFAVSQLVPTIVVTR
jgi:hypothetical protein